MAKQLSKPRATIKSARTASAQEKHNSPGGTGVNAKNPSGGGNTGRSDAEVRKAGLAKKQ